MYYKYSCIPAYYTTFKVYQNQHVIKFKYKDLNSQRKHLLRMANVKHTLVKHSPREHGLPFTSAVHVSLCRRTWYINCIDRHLSHHISRNFWWGHKNQYIPSLVLQNTLELLVFLHPELLSVLGVVHRQCVGTLSYMSSNLNYFTVWHCSTAETWYSSHFYAMVSSMRQASQLTGSQ